MTNVAAGSVPQVRRFHAILLWPLQLVPVRESGGAPPWEVLQRLGGPWRMTRDAGCADLSGERQYSEFVSFLPYVQRCLYGEPQGAVGTPAESPIRIFERDDIATARVTFERDAPPIDFAVENVQLYFFFDVEIVVLAVEIHADDLPLPTVQDTLFRFGRAFPAFWNTDGRGGHCLERVEWISPSGAVLATSDFEQRERYLRFVAEHRTACIASHWEYLLEPLVGHDSDKSGPLRYRQIEYYRMPWMAYLALDNPALLTRATFARLALGAPPGDPDSLPFSARSLMDFESRYCYDRYWAPAERPNDTNTRYLCSGHAFAMVGSAGDRFFMDPEGGLLGQFRHQYAKIGLLSHFHRAALLMLSDRLVVAHQPAKHPRCRIGQAFQARHPAHDGDLPPVHSSLLVPRGLHPGPGAGAVPDVGQPPGHRPAVRRGSEEVQDMNEYLDSDSLRRQANTVVRLTVVTTLGLIGTVATGILGMNIFAYADQPWLVKLGIFVAVLVPSVAIILYSVVRSKVLAELLEALSDDRKKWGEVVKPARRSRMSD